MGKSRIWYGDRPVKDIPDEEVTHIRLYKEDDEWWLDGVDDNGNYSTACWSYDSWRDAVNDLPAFRATFFPRIDNG